MPQTFRTLAEYVKPLDLTPLHPHLTAIDFASLPPHRYQQGVFGFYAIILKENLGCGALQYGLGTYDYQAGTVLCVAPGQLFGPKDDGVKRQGKGKALLIHPAFLQGTPLAEAFSSATFFTYATREALHLSEDERGFFLEQFHAIVQELSRLRDTHSEPILRARLAVLLHLLTRFYERQFASRTPENRAVLSRLETFLASTLPDSPEAPPQALPTVAACAKALSLSPNYLGDLVRKETGSSAQAFIAHAILSRAKTFLADTSASIAQISEVLGFSYPHHFTRFFRKYAGVPPRTIAPPANRRPAPSPPKARA